MPTPSDLFSVKLKKVILNINALLTFVKFKVEKKIVFGNGVIAGLTANIAKFTDLPVSLILLAASQKALSEGETLAITGDRTAKNKLKILIANWNTDFKNTAKYVSAIAKGDASIISGAGFTPSKGNSDAGIVPTLFEGFRLATSLIKGFFSAKVGAIKGFKNLIYVFIATPDTMVITQENGNLVVTVGTVIGYIKIGTSHTVNFENIPHENINVTAFGVNGMGMGPMNTPIEITPA